MENCPDIRNTRVVDIVQELKGYGARVDIFDPWADARETRHEYGLALTAQPRRGAYDAVIPAVAHRQFREMGARAIRALGRRRSVLYDIKYVLRARDVDGRL